MFHTVIHDCKELGDALMTTPALRQLSASFREHRLSCWCATCRTV